MSKTSKVLTTFIASICTTMLLGATTLAAPPVQARAITHKLDIPAQDLGTALKALGAAANEQVLFSDDVVAGLHGPPLKGEYSTDEAITLLLKNSGLKADRTPSGVLLIRSPQSSSLLPLERAGSPDTHGTDDPGVAKESNQKGFWSRFRLAQAEPASKSDTQPSSEKPTAENSSESFQKRIELEEIVVTGSHIRGIENGTAPVTILDRQYIDSTGISSVPDLMATLPQNFALNNQSGVFIPGSSGGSAQGAAISLRGIGEGTTLTLLNGRRPAMGFLGAAMDIAALPLTAVERVEVLTDGASALYGSDAVGGVVNFVLRKDFDGFETRLRSGWADGVNEYRASQLAGTRWDSGNALLSVEYYKRDLLLASDRDFIPSASMIPSLLPEDKNLGVLFSGRQALTNAVRVFADALYTMRDSFNMSNRISGFNAEVENPQISATAGLDWRIGGQWQLELSGTYGKNHQERTLVSDGTRPANDIFTSPFHVKMGQVKVDGPLVSLAGGEMRAAIGADWRTESISYASYDDAGNRTGVADSDDQIVRSAFAEVHVPLIGPANALPAARRVELSLAGRYDDYSKFGSSTNPMLGLSWVPVESVRLRGNWGTSYRAPRLIDYSPAINATQVFYTDDPGTGAESHVLLVSGTATDELTAEESENLSFGADFTPTFLEGLKLSVNFFRIDYTQRIDSPASNATVLLANPGAFGSLVDRNPTLEKIDRYIAIGNTGQGFFAFTRNFERDLNFDPSTIDVLIDLRRRNLSAVEAGGMDLSVQYDFTLAGGKVHLSADATHLRELRRRVTPTSTAVSIVATYSNPVDWRFRAGAGWVRRGLAANVFVNYTDAYADNRITPIAAISSYTTVDARLAFDFGQRFASGPFSGLTLAANVQNLFDEDPPRTAIVTTFSDMGFDSTNSNPMGRLVSLELTKNWGR